MAANERDLAPLGESDLSSLSPEDAARSTRALDTAASLVDTAPAAAAAAAELVILRLPSHARAHYVVGRAQYAQKKYAAAIDSFQKAIDLDPMPWRCPSRGNQAIRDAAAEGGAILCDLQAEFRKASPGGCVGWELMDDHVHPTLAGQAFTARAIVRAMTALNGSLAVSSESVVKLPSDAEYVKRLGDNEYDRYGVAHTLRVICDVPFIRKTNPQAFERFDSICREYERAWPPARPRGRTEMAGPADAPRFEASDHRNDRPRHDSPGQVR